jgi:hypothetical protein
LAVQPLSAKTTAEDLEDFRGELADFFTNVHEISPTAFGSQPIEPGALMEIRKSIGRLTPAELHAMHGVFSTVPNWKMAPEMMSTALTPEQRQELSIIADDLVSQEQALEEFRRELAGFYATVKLVPGESLGALGTDRTSVTQAQELVEQMEPLQLALLRQELDQNPEWTHSSEALRSALPPAARAALETLADAGALDAESIAELEEFREELLSVFSGMLLLPAAEIEFADLEALDLAIEEVRNMTPEMLYVLRASMDRSPDLRTIPESLQRNLSPDVRRDLEVLASHGPITETDRVALEEFRRELATVQEELASLSPELGSVARRQNVLAELTAQELVMIRGRLEQNPAWKILPVYLDASQSPHLRHQQQIIAQAAPDSAELADLDNFRSQLAISFDQMAGNRASIERARENLAAVSYNDLLLVQEMYARAGPEGAPAVTDAVVWSLEKSKQGPIGGMLEDQKDCGLTNLVGCIHNLFHDLEDVIEGAVDGVLDGVNEIAGVVDDIGDDIADIISDIQALPSTLINAIEDLAGEVLNALPDPSDIEEFIVESAAFLGMPVAFDLSIFAPLATVFDTLAVCPTEGTPIPGFGDVGQSSTSNAYARVIWIIEKLIAVVPSTELAAPVKLAINRSLAPYLYLKVCLEQATNVAKQKALVDGQVSILADIDSAKSMLADSIDATESNLAGEITGAKSMLTDSILTSESNLAGNIASSTSALTASIIAAENNLTAAIEAAGDGQIAAIDAHFDNLYDLLGEMEAFDLRLKIERLLGSEPPGSRIALFQQPDSVGGYLELVRDIVLQSIQTADTLGQDVSNALKDFDKGEDEYGDGQYIMAFEWYRKAYRRVLDG